MSTIMECTEAEDAVKDELGPESPIIRANSTGYTEELEPRCRGSEKDTGQLIWTKGVWASLHLSGDWGPPRESK